MSEQKGNSAIKWIVIAMLITPIPIAVLFIVYVDLFGGLIFTAVMVLCVAAAVGVHLNLWKKCHYICPACVTPFKPDFISSLTAMNYYDQRKMRCPKCGCHQLMKVHEDKDAPGRIIYRR